MIIIIIIIVIITIKQSIYTAKDTNNKKYIK